MTLAGLLIMIVSVSAVLSLAGFCFYKVLTHPDSAADGQPSDPDDA